MAWEMFKVAKCDECGHRWLTSGEPKRCAKCKSTRWNSGMREAGLRSQARKEVEKGDFNGVARVSGEEFFRMTNSEKLKAKREGRY